MGCNCGKKKKKLNNNYMDLVQIKSMDENGNVYYLIVDKSTSKVIDTCKSKFTQIPLVESVIITR